MAANTIVKQVKKKGFIIEQLDKKIEVFLLACLLHDIGHAPFSHTGVKFYLEDSPQNKYLNLHSKLATAVDSEISQMISHKTTVK